VLVMPETIGPKRISSTKKCGASTWVISVTTGNSAKNRRDRKEMIIPDRVWIRAADDPEIEPLRRYLKQVVRICEELPGLIESDRQMLSPYQVVKLHRMENKRECGSNQSDGGYSDKRKQKGNASCVLGDKDVQYFGRKQTSFSGGSQRSGPRIKCLPAARTMPASMPRKIIW